MFDSVLIANRGEIAVRITRTLRALGIRSIAVYSDADRDARHVVAADAAYRIGPAAASGSYLDVDRILDAAIATGAQALHPGYGFLSENARLAEACRAAGIVFVGPPLSAIEAMGDKIKAKELVASHGVRVVPGVSGIRLDGTALDDAELAERALEVGFPLLIKPSAGGGGKGMRVVESPDRLLLEIAAAKREALGAFGDDTLLIERLIQRPRHIEVQILADAHGNVVHLGERECSLQRRHQKVIEEAPSPFLSDGDRELISAQAVAAARACGYENAGTVEFIVAGDRPHEPFFMEMNTRLQVEHPVTEMVWGLDLVEHQLRIASGEPLGFSQLDLLPSGHAMEARVYAEDPQRGFLPTGGVVRTLREPDDLLHVRVDSSLLPGTEIGSNYDPMLSKVIAWGPDRDTARLRLDHALSRSCILGVTTNTGFLRTVLADEHVAAGALDTGLVERIADRLPPAALPEAVAIAAAILPRLSAGAADDPWQDLGGWRLGPSASSSWRAVGPDGNPVEVSLRRAEQGWEAKVDGGTAVPFASFLDGEELRLDVAGGQTVTFTAIRAGATTWLGAGGETWSLTEVDVLAPGAAAHRTGETTIASPMPGTVVSVHVAPGDQVIEGQTIAVVEAMKMEHTLRAPFDAVVREVLVAGTDQVARDQVLAVLEAVVTD
ncbi:MAG: hypothetical protein JWL73_1291 [Actinomycetia bacterium]|nr:hypothetical protein [Actinomycetes bacterium]